MHRVRPTAAYFAILGTQGFARGLMFAALLSYWVIQAGLNPLQLVLLGTALEATLFVFQIPTGAFADTVGRRPATVIGYAFLGIGLGLQAFTRNFEWLLWLQVLSGAAWAFLIGPMEAWIADRAAADDLERVFLRGGQAELIGLMGGLVMTLFLAQISPSISIVLGGALLVVVSGMAALLMTESKASDSQAGSRWREVVTTAATGLRRIRSSRVLLLLVVIALVLGISSEGWDRLYVAHLMRDLGLQSVRRLTPVGWLALIGLVQCGLGVVMFQWAAGRITGRRPGTVLAALYLSQCLLMLGFVFLTSLPIAVVAFLGAGTVRGLGAPLVDAWIARETPSEIRATVLSVVGQADSIGEVIAGPIVGLIGIAVSVGAALVVSAALLVPAALLAVVTQRFTRAA